MDTDKVLKLAQWARNILAESAEDEHLDTGDVLDLLAELARIDATAK